MPISKVNYGSHGNVLLLEFGTGDIMFTKGEQASGEMDLIFTQDIPHEIGAEAEDYLGKSSDEIPNIHLVMRFTRPESISALIHSLVEQQKALFKKQKVAKCE